MDAKPENPYESPLATADRHKPAAATDRLRLHAAIVLAVGLGFATVILDSISIAPSGPNWIHSVVEPVFGLGCLALVIYAGAIAIFDSRK